jgi:hypothetical protein
MVLIWISLVSKSTVRLFVLRCVPNFQLLKLLIFYFFVGAKLGMHAIRFWKWKMSSIFCPVHPVVTTVHIQAI